MFPYWGPIANISAKWVTATATCWTTNFSLLLGIPTQSQRSPHCCRSYSSLISFEIHSFHFPWTSFTFLCHRRPKRTASEWFLLSRSLYHVPRSSHMLTHFHNIFDMILSSPSKFFLWNYFSSQTFGHLEFVLKLAEFSHLREEAPYPQVIICVGKTNC